MLSAILFLNKIKSKKAFKILHLFVVVGSLLIIFIVGPYLFYTISFMGKIYSNIYIARTNVGGMSPESAIVFLSENTTQPPNINLISQTKAFRLNTESLGLSYNYVDSVNRAYNLTRTGNFFIDTYERIKLVFNQKNLGFIVDLDESKLSSFLSTITKEISINPVYPSIELINGNVEINKGVPGNILDFETLRFNIGQQLAYKTNNDIYLLTKVSDPTLNDFQSITAKTRAERYLGKSLLFKFEDKNYTFNDNDILKFLDPKTGYNNQSIMDTENKIATDINREPQMPKFEFDGKRVTEFSPALDGVSIDSKSFKNLLVTNLDKLSSSTDQNISLDVPIVTTKPPVTTEQINNLGIKERIGHGTSTYFHSIPGRVFNVNLAASRINGTLVASGETFSFNQTLGDVSKFTGYQQAYIISGGKTILGDGGGVCQVSTTLFRAVMNAGLPINNRSPHAYRVGYYEQSSPPGMDATVYYPTTDFKFTNDTGNYILIQAKNDPVNYSLVFDLYGTSDGRVSQVSKPIISNYSPPLPTIYQDDPTLSNGTLKQTDFAAAGAKITFNYSVTKNGENIYNKTFVSNYQPWAAAYLRGTK